MNADHVGVIIHDGQAVVGGENTGEAANELRVTDEQGTDFQHHFCGTDPTKEKNKL